jgi:hypothetical protein
MRPAAEHARGPSARAPRARLIAAAIATLAAAGLASRAAAQRDDVPLPPRLEREPVAAPNDGARAPDAPPIAVGAPTQGAGRPPNAASLAPLPEERADPIEEIVVIGSGWRLPDLGSAWRAKQKEKEESGRFSATFLPLYDPDDPPQHIESPWLAPEARRVGYIELFRLRFGRRAPR